MRRCSRNNVKKPNLIAAFLIGVAIVAAPFLRRERVVPSIRDPLPSGSLERVMVGIEQASTVELPDRDVPAAIVPHHLTAARSIALGIRAVARAKPRTILLVSPDHFYRCPTPVCTAYGEFSTTLGTVRTSDDLVERLAASEFVTVDPSLFGQEHGIGAVLPFVLHELPDALIVPVALSSGWFERKDDIRDLLADLAARTDAIVVSSDFSHYLDLATSDAMDEATMETFFAADLDGILALRNPDQSDCPVCLWSLASIALDEGFFNPSVLAHTNSARILNDPKNPSTTSHFAMAFFRNDALSSDDLAVAGDVTMTRTTRVPTLKPTMKAFWDGPGLRFVNLEGPLADTCARDRKMFTFCNAKALWNGMVGLATHWAIMNNHMLDRHEPGIGVTKAIIEESGETWVGDSIVRSGSTSLLSLTTLMNPVADARAIDISASYKHTLAEINAEPASQFIVVLVHAGAEYRALGSDAYHAYLRTFVDAGADAVVAAHAHVLSDMEIYKGVPIFRGVGNFIFDQFANVSTSTAMAVRLRRENGRVMFETLRTAK
jgi:AmmeMemoRadiSam system protein B